MTNYQLLLDVASSERAPDAAAVRDDSQSGIGRVYQRLMRTLQAPDHMAGEVDRAALLRHVLRAEEIEQGGPKWLRIPKDGAWPNASVLREHGFESLDQTEALNVRARPWQPSWLPGSQKETPAQSAFAGEWRRQFEPVPGDPFLASMGFEERTYRCTGQREAVRHTLTAPPGATLAVNLPTGAGKSLCAHLMAMLNPAEKGVVVVVVPTVALALDQERALKDIIDHQTAYRGGTDEKTKARNDEIVKRVRNGEQRIVFTSPEALMGRLSTPVYEAARSGYLRALVIDEAHMVDQWGDDFRSSFQDMTGLRADLLRACSGEAFRTLLLSATLSNAALRTVRDFFAEPGPFEVLSAVQLRPEPSYWFEHCVDAEEREVRLLEAIRHLPRPLILYATRREDAREWFQILRSKGYRRIETITGSTSTADRNRVIEQWRSASLDVVVATSAFGLGVDQADVRAVVHACVPEDVNRFYQEVGRGGRDGRASVSLMLYTDEDLSDAKGLNERRIISIDKGRQRWEQMFSGRDAVASMGEEQAGIKRWRVPIDVGRMLDMGGENEANQSWNVRTLTLMHRAGMLRIDGEPPPEVSEFEEKEEWTEALEWHSRHRTVQLLDDQHLDERQWNRQVEPIRSTIREETRQGLHAMKHILRGEVCIADTFASVYRQDHASDGRGSVGVSKACGGCPACRAAGRKRHPEPMPRPMPVWTGAVSHLHDRLQRKIGEEGRLYLFFTSGDQQRRWEGKLVRAIGALIRLGVRVVAAPQNVLDLLGREGIGKKQPVFFVSISQPGDPMMYMPDLPHLIYCPTREDLREEHLSYSGEAECILVAPREVPDPRAPRRRLRMMVPGVSFRWSTFFEQVGA